MSNSDALLQPSILISLLYVDILLLVRGLFMSERSTFSAFFCSDTIWYSILKATGLSKFLKQLAEGV